MKNNNNTNNGDATTTDQFKSHNNRHSISKFEHELFKDSDNKIESIIRIKRTNGSGGERWRIYEDNKIVYTLESEKLNNKERDFLRTPAGFTFLIEQYKLKFTSLKSLRDSMKVNLTATK